MLALESVTKRFRRGNYGVRDVSLDLSGGVLGLLGPNGAGKTTITGIVLIVAAATSLGVVSSNPKTFIVLFLTFWYVVVNDHGATPALDFAGWFGSVPTDAIAVYAAISAGLLGVAAMVHKLKLAHS